MISMTNLHAFKGQNLFNVSRYLTEKKGIVTDHWIVRNIYRVCLKPFGQSLSPQEERRSATAAAMHFLFALNSTLWVFWILKAPGMPLAVVAISSTSLPLYWSCYALSRSKFYSEASLLFGLLHWSNLVGPTFFLSPEAAATMVRIAFPSFILPQLMITTFGTLGQLIFYFLLTAAGEIAVAIQHQLHGNLDQALITNLTRDILVFILCISASALKRKDVDQIEAERKQSQTQSKLASLGEMAAGVAHEINNPLTIILGTCKQLQRTLEMVPPEQNLDPKIKTLTARIETTSLRIAKIVAGLRTFSRNSMSDPPTTYNLNRWLNETIALVEGKAKDKQVELKIQTPGDDIAFECRPSEMLQVLLNLLNNAIEAIDNLPGPRWVSVEASRQQEWLEVVVTDSGSGIPPGVASRLMQPFFTTKPVGKGTGLGLSVSYGIVVSHGGVLSYDSTCPNTRFKIRLPLSQIGRQSAAAAQEKSAA